MYVIAEQYLDLIVANSREHSVESACSRRVASTDKALYAVHQGLPHGFRCARHLPGTEFLPWIFNVGREYHIMYSTAHVWFTCVKWLNGLSPIYDIANTIRAAFCGGLFVCLYRTTKQAVCYVCRLCFRISCGGGHIRCRSSKGGGEMKSGEVPVRFEDKCSG